MDVGFEYAVYQGKHNKHIKELQIENEQLQLKMYEDLRKLAEKRIREGRDLGILGKGGNGMMNTSYKYRDPSASIIRTHKAT